MSNLDKHVPVMSREVQEYLNLPKVSCFVDCTLGLGGHASLIATQLKPPSRIIGIDRDGESLKRAREKLAGMVDHLDCVHDDFRNLDVILDRLQVKTVDGILLDLGISSFQLENTERGFSFQKDGPLDMRMDQESFICAYDLVNSLSEQEIALILRNYGEERLAGRIARQIVTRRTQKPIETTGQLAETVLKVMPRYHSRKGFHPATRTFQAFRIAVNRELEAVEAVLEKCIPFLRPGGRLCVIAFHSLEDRIVKQKFRALGKERKGQCIVKKPLRPSEEEIRRNPRSRSARLRVFERI